MLLAPAAEAQDEAPLLTLAPPNGAEGFGGAVTGVPDANGDGLYDLLVGAAELGENEGAFLFNGATGDLLHELAPPEEGTVNFGAAVSGVPDVDGRGDLLVGADFAGPGTGPEFAGRAYLFSGATGALLRTLASPNERRSGFFGRAVSGVPDADGDGRSDLLVGAPGERVGGNDAGRIYLFSGATGALLFAKSGVRSLGEAVAGVPDVDGDGRGDVIVGDPDAFVIAGGMALTRAGRAWLYSGATGTLLYDLQAPEPRQQAQFGSAVAALPDTDGDGVADLLVGQTESTRLTSGVARTGCYSTAPMSTAVS